MEMLICIGSPRDVRNFEMVVRDAKFHAVDAESHQKAWLDEHRTNLADAAYYVVCAPSVAAIRDAIAATRRSMGHGWDAPIHTVLDTRDAQD